MAGFLTPNLTWATFTFSEKNCAVALSSEEGMKVEDSPDILAINPFL